jgi:hypothetical protein
VQATTAVGPDDRMGGRGRDQPMELHHSDYDVAMAGAGGVGTGAGGAGGREWEVRNRERLGIRYVRGCEVHQILDAEKEVIGARDAEGRPRRAVGHQRTYRVVLDSAQYARDQTGILDRKAEDPYTTFNLLVRRRPEENNFKAVLATIRDLMLNER